MKTQKAVTTKEFVYIHPKPAMSVTVPVGTPVHKVFGGIGFVDHWYVTDFDHIENPIFWAEVGLPVPDSHVEFPE